LCSKLQFCRLASIEQHECSKGIAMGAKLSLYQAPGFTSGVAMNEVHSHPVASHPSLLVATTPERVMMAIASQPTPTSLDGSAYRYSLSSS